MLDSIGYGILDKLVKTAFWEWFTKKYLSSFTLRAFGYPKFPMEDFFKIADRMDDDKIYVFACSDYSSLGSKVIRGISGAKFTHAGFILPHQLRYRHTKVLHMRSIGLQCEHSLSLLREVDYFCVVEVPLTPEAVRGVKKALTEAAVMKDRYKYDFEEKLDNGEYRLYCSEFIYTMLKGLGIKFRTSKVLQREVFMPDDILSLGPVVYTNLGG